MKARHGNVLVVVLASVMLAGTALAGTPERLGTGGNSEGRILVGARSVGLAYSNVASVKGAEALFGNPAGLAAAESGTEVLFSTAKYLADMNVNYIALAQQLGGMGHIGLSVKVLSVGDIIRTTETAPDGTGDVFTPTFTTIGLSYAKSLTERANFGGTVRLISESVLQTSSTGVSFDFGFQYDTGVRGIRLAACMQNFGPAQLFGGSDFERNVLFPEDDPQSANRTVGTTTSESELPSLFSGSASMPLVTGDVSHFDLHALYQSNSFNVDEFRFGAEYGYRQDFALRVGYKYTTDDDELFGLTYGLGVRVPIGASKMQLDYAGQQVNDFFDDVHHIGLTFRF
jgi:hypothetical protein